MHVSTVLDDGSWVVEVRPPGEATGPVDDVHAGETLLLPDGVRLTVEAPHPRGQRRLWRAAVPFEGPPADYLARHGRPIRYAYVPHALPLAEYQTVFARDPGSAEMPSAGRPFTTGLVTELVTRGIGVAPITLHTGVSSQDVGEPPQPERFAVPAATARAVESARAAGGRVVAVGTTVTRALESALDGAGHVVARTGWTDLVLGSGASRPRRHRSGDGLARPGRLAPAPARGGGRSGPRRAAPTPRPCDPVTCWHEFGDSCLLLPA